MQPTVEPPALSAKDALAAQAQEDKECRRCERWRDESIRESKLCSAATFVLPQADCRWTPFVFRSNCAVHVGTYGTAPTHLFDRTHHSVQLARTCDLSAVSS